MKNAQEIFASLKEILLPYADKLIVVTDQENTFYLNTHHIMKNKQPMYFGSTAVKKKLRELSSYAGLCFSRITNRIIAVTQKKNAR